MRVANHLAVDAADGRHDGQHATDLAAVSWGFDEALDLTGIAAQGFRQARRP